jgi:hypothetical protein
VVTDPYSKKAKFTRYTQALQSIEEKAPGTKRVFYKGYLKNIHRFQDKTGVSQPLKRYSICGTPTVLDVGNFCVHWRNGEIR